jgi:S-adenosylmethionine:tRNA ribosyltransferase-isomerase
MRIEELDFELPSELVAQTPIEPRDASRLLVYERCSGSLTDGRFTDLPDLLVPGDVLVRNDTRVIAARTHFRRATGGRLEVLFLERALAMPAGGEVWEVLVRGRPRVGEIITCTRTGDDMTVAGGGRSGDEWRLLVEDSLGEGRWRVRSLSEGSVHDRLEIVGETPLPPYIKRRLDEPERYQTVYARVRGSAAAPTAGLHFTSELDRLLAQRGVAVESLTLHVGLGTFQSLAAAEVETQKLHSEPYAAEAATWRRIVAARHQGRRVIAVGTTMARLLETLARAPAGDDGAMRTRSGPSLVQGRTDLFITPGFEFRLVDGLLTNFHLPRSSLLALVMAFCGVEETRRLYRHAVERRYRFYSFGDAMLAL